MNEMNEVDLEAKALEVSKKTAIAVGETLANMGLDGVVEDDGGGPYIYISKVGVEGLPERDNGADFMAEDYRCLSVFDEDFGENPEDWKWTFWNHSANVYENSELTIDAKIDEAMEFLLKCMKIEKEAFRKIAESAK